jgi:hypothetical protein
MAVQSKGVATHHPGFDKYAPKWKRCRDVSDGQDAVHAAGTLYLPKLKGESDGTGGKTDDNDYAARVKRSNFFNGTWRTLAILNGMLFRKPPTQDVPAGIEPYLADVDMAGASIETFARCLALEVLEVGRVGIMVDHPPQQVDDDGKVVPITQAVAEQMGFRPLIQTYRAECIINWKYRRIRNRTMLSMVVLQETVREPDGEFAEKEVTQYRVLDLDEADEYRVRIFQRVNDKDVQIGGDMYPLMNGKRLGYIPFAIVGTDGIESGLDEPPLIDLVDANIAHYQLQSDYRHTLHFCPPTFYIAGYQAQDGEKISIGGSAALIFPDPQAKVAFAEPEGNMLPALRDALNETKQEMALLGARAIADETKQAETLGATAIKRSGENSILSSIAIAISEALEWALTIFSEWAGQAGDVTYQLNRDFMPPGIDAQQLTALVAAVQAGEISKQELFTLLQRADVIDSAIKYEEHQAAVEVETPSPARPTKKPGEEIAA